MKKICLIFMTALMICLSTYAGYGDSLREIRVRPEATPSATEQKPDEPTSFLTIRDQDDSDASNVLPFSENGYLLPIDFSGGSVPLPEGYLSDYFYGDSTITVEIQTGREDGCSYWIADIVINDPSQLRTISAGGYDSGMVMDGMNLSNRVNAVLAINGDFPNSSERRGKGYIIRQGELIRDSLDEPGHWDSKMMDVLLIDERGDFHVLYQPGNGTVPETWDGLRILNAFTFGPILVDQGEKVEDYSVSSRWIDMAVTQQRQRICICQAGKLHYKIICCAGPSHGNSGMTMDQFAHLVWKQDVQIAYNLDGGDSTMLYFNGQRVNSYGNTSMRKLQDIIYFASAEDRK